MSLIISGKFSRNSLPSFKKEGTIKKPRRSITMIRSKKGSKTATNLGNFFSKKCMSGSNKNANNKPRKKGKNA